MKTKLSKLAIAMAACSCFSAQAYEINLNNAGFVQYGDGLSYSLPIAGISFGSTPGAIQDYVVLATGSEGQQVTTNFSGMDNAYSTPSGVSGETFFYANNLTDRGSTGTIYNNGGNTWDSSLSALKTFLAGDQMVFMFNNNNLNGHDEQSLAAWGRMWLTDIGGNVVTGSTMEFTNRNSKYALVTEGGGGQFLGNPLGYTAPGSGAGNPIAGNFSNTDFVLSGGAVCVMPGTIPVPVACGTPGSIGPINHNLGADRVAYAILFPELNGMLNSMFATITDELLAEFTLHVDLRMGCGGKEVVAETANNGKTTYSYGGAQANWMTCGVSDDDWGNSMNNGYEQVFLARAAQSSVVPEPGSLMLLSGALLGLFALRRKSNDQS